ncbi:MAG TPA: hypothetical protein VFB76_09330 [Candidatus Angelobacter sp.]|nr:hypothetical protein [Candidatus Angelobacter sp.]
MPVHFRAVKQVIEILRVHLQGKRLPQSNHTEILLDGFQHNEAAQKKPPVKITFLELQSQMEQELQALNQLLRH